MDYSTTYIKWEKKKTTKKKTQTPLNETNCFQNENAMQCSSLRLALGDLLMKTHAVVSAST